MPDLVPGQAMQELNMINYSRESQDCRECTGCRDVYCLLRYVHVSELSDNDKAATMQIKDLKMF